MAATKKPKLADVQEALLKEMDDFRKTVKKQENYLQNFKPQVNVEPLTELEKSNETKREAYMNRIIEEVSDLKVELLETRKTIAGQNKDLLGIYRFIKSRTLIYTTLIFVFLFSLACFSSYYAGKNYLDKSDYDQLKQKNEIHKAYFDENPKLESRFNKWVDENSSKKAE